MRRVLRWFLYTVCLLLLLVVGAALMLQTGPGKRLLASELTSMLSSEEAGFTIAAIEGSIPLDMRVGSLELSDPEGVWLKVDGVTFDWSPSALLSGRIQIDEIAAERIEFVRPPIGDDAPEPVSDEPFRLPELPESLPPITIERLAVPEILLGETVLGEAAAFALDGSLRADDAGKEVTAKLGLERTDKPTVSAALDATAKLSPPSLDLALNAVENGGMIGELAGRSDIGDVEITLEGKGPLDDWAGRLDADAEGLALIEADLGLALVEQPRLTIEGGVQPAAGSLPAEIAELIGERLTLGLDVVQTRAQALDLQKIEIGTSLATLDADGSVDFDAGDLALRAGLDLPDLAPLSELAKAGLSGKMTAALDVGGTLDAPDGTLDLQIDAPAFDDKTADAITSALRWSTLSPLSSDRPAFDLSLDGGASGLVIPGTVLPDPDIAWNAEVSAPLEGEVTIERIAIETAGSSLSASGGIDPARLDGSIDLVLDAPSLERLASPYGQAVDGSALIEAAIQLADGAENIAVDLDASLDRLEGLPPGAAELLGERATIAADMLLDPSRTLSLEGLAIDGAAIGLDGGATIGLDLETIEGRLTLALPDLTVLEPLMPKGAAGAITLDADLGGSFSAPSADLQLSSENLVVAGEPIEALGIDLKGQDLIARPAGDLLIDVTARGMPVTLALDYLLADGRLTLDAIDLKAPETAIGGALAVELETTAIDGALNGRIADLGAFEPMTQQPLGGSVDLAVTLEPDDNGQNARLTLDGEAIGGGFGKIETLDVEASATDVMAEPAFDAKASLTGFEQGTTAIDGLTFTANGDAGAVDFALDVAGEAIQPLEISAAGNAAFADGLALGLEKLQGAFAGEPLRLTKPLTLRQKGDGSIQIADLDLRLGEAQLSGDVDMGARDVKGAIDLRDLPLSWSETFGGPALSGAANADIDLGGSVTDPTVTASLNVDDLLAEDVAPGELPVDIVLDASLVKGRLDADFTGSGLTKKPITASASLPARLALRPFAFDMPENGDLEGRIDAELLLSRLADFLALDDQTLKGTLTADIEVGGTLGEPRIEGPVRLRGGGYENGTTGTDIRDLILTATASNERIELSELKGSTGKKGLLASEGWLQLDADANFPLSFSLDLTEARLVDRDDVEARISGNIAMSGDLGEAVIEGDLNVDRAEISIPDGGGSGLPEIEVTEVGRDVVDPPEEEETASDEEKPFDPSLDLRIRLPNKIFVRGRGLESEWEGDLRISGRASEPSIVGDLRIKKGFFDFLDKRFQLARGEITFSGSTPPNPLIALEARAEDDDFTAIIKLNGPADDPQLLLESEPQLPEDEVLARLLFNRELSEIGPVEAGKLALALNRLRGGGGFDAFGEIRDVLRIDTLDVVSDEEGETAVKAGKYLNDDVYVEVEKGAGGDTGRARVEIELLPNIALEADTSEDANSGVGLKWKFNY